MNLFSSRRRKEKEEEEEEEEGQETRTELRLNARPKKNFGDKNFNSGRKSFECFGFGDAKKIGAVELSTLA